MSTGSKWALLWVFAGILATVLRYAAVTIWHFWTPDGRLAVAPGWFTALNFGWLAVWGATFLVLASSERR